MNLEIPHYPHVKVTAGTHEPEKTEAPVDPVKRSLAKPDAFAKPGKLSTGKPVRVRTLKFTARRKRKRDYRDVDFF